MVALKTPKGKKCDYCDEYADFKIREEGLYTYLCKACYKDVDKAKLNLNE